MEKHENKKIGFQLVNIVTDQFAIIKDNYDKHNTDVNISTEATYGIDDDEKLIKSGVKIEFSQNKSVFLLAEISNHYVIDNKTWEKEIKKYNKFVIPKDFATHLLVLTIGTIRGVLHAKIENTEFNKFLLPTLNISKLISSDIEFTE